MECTIVTYKGKDELMYGRQEYTGLDDIGFYEVSESLVKEIASCALDEVQNVIAKIKTTCPKLF